MGKAFSGLVRRPVRNWNVENRAQKVIEKMGTEKPNPAPAHQSTRQQLEDFRQDHPEYYEAQKMKHEGLHERLQGLVVNPDRVQEVTSALKPLPSDRTAFMGYEYGYPEPVVIPPGQCSLKQFLEMLNRHHMDPAKDSPDVLAAEYSVDAEKLADALKHFRMYEIQFPKDKKALLADEHSDAKPLAPGFKMRLLGGKKAGTDSKTEIVDGTK